MKFSNLPLRCWSPPCLSKIASVLGKPIQYDQLTSNLSRLSYARVLIKIDLREELRHSIEVSLPSGPTLYQKVVYETLPKFCNFYHVLGQSHLLCPKAAASTQKKSGNHPQTQVVLADKGSVFIRLGPLLKPQGFTPSTLSKEQGQASQDKVPSIAPVVDPVRKAPSAVPDGWITVESRRKASKQPCCNPNGKEVVVVEDVSDVNPYKTLSPLVCAREI